MKFEDLKVWQRSSRLACELYQVFAGSRDYVFRHQITRAGLSVPCNIAEGFDRGSHREFIRFLRIAKGSCGELRTQLYIAREIGYLSPERVKEFLDETRSISAMLASLIRTRQRFLRSADKTGTDYVKPEKPPAS